MDLPALPATLQPATAGAAKADAATALSSDFDTFLTLLTAQIENQDPLNPQDATEYASQLATFSNVEQNVRTNDLMKDLIARIDGQGLAALAGWIGMEARVTGPTAYEGGTVTLDAALPVMAQTAEVVVTDEAGTEVARVPVDPRQTTHVVRPVTPTGEPLAPGTYGFAVQPYAPGGQLRPVDAARYVSVREALVEGGTTKLVLDGGVKMDASAVGGLRPAAAVAEGG